jgi:hypothetical protein
MGRRAPAYRLAQGRGRLAARRLIATNAVNVETTAPPRRGSGTIVCSRSLRCPLALAC